MATDWDSLRQAAADELQELGLKWVTVGNAEHIEEMVHHGTAALYVSVHGRAFKGQGRCPRGGNAEPLKCFANAQRVARECRVGYAEGFAGPFADSEWTLHAWNLDRQQRVLDPTWGRGAGRHYFGIHFPWKRLPSGEEEGTSVIVNITRGKVVSWDRHEGLQLLDLDSPVGKAVVKAGGLVLGRRG